MRQIVIPCPITPELLEKDAERFEPTTVHVLNLPFQASPVCEFLPEENGKFQYSIREDLGWSLDKIAHEQGGWTVEFRSPESPEWADVWITATLFHDEGLASGNQRTVQTFPAMNLSLEEAMRIAKEMTDSQQKKPLEPQPLPQWGLVRARHQFSGNIILGDLFR